MACCGPDKQDSIDDLRDFLTPPRIKSGEIRFAKHTIWACGLAADTVHDVTVDGKIELIQSHPDSELCLCPRRGHPHPSFSDAWFYCDCIAYEHDLPAVVYPQTSELRRLRYRYIHSGPRKPKPLVICSVDTGEATVVEPLKKRKPLRAEEFYVKHLLAILDELRAMRHGPLSYVLFRHYKEWDPVDLPYTSQYGPTAEGIHLYAGALRQTDALAEYLFYYRVIEQMTGIQGRSCRDWIEQALGSLHSHDFGFIPIGHERCPEEPPRNLLSEYHRRALLRLRQLLRKHNTLRGVVDYLYYTNRCGIAHGRAFIRSDISPNYFEVVRDTYVLKLLARMAIDEVANR